MADENKNQSTAPSTSGENKSLKERSKPQKPQVVVEGLDEFDVASIIDTESLDPDFTYRFGHIRPQRQSRLRMKGYVPVDRDEVDILADGVGGEEEDKIIHNDVILMKAPRESVERRRKEVRQLSARRIKAPEGSFRKKASNTRVGGLPVKVITTEGEED